MTVNEYLRRAAGLAAAVALSVSAPQHAVAQAPKVTTRFSAMTTWLSAGSGVNINIDVLRWSSDEESVKLVAAYKGNKDKWADALDAAPSVGYVWPAAADLGYSVKLARKLPSPGGGSRIILAVSPALGSWDRPAWKGPNDLATDYPFTVIELRLNRAGVGDGKASLAGKLAVDEAAIAVVLEDYAAAPILFNGVRSGARGAAPASQTGRPGTSARPASAPPSAKPAPPKK